MAWAVPPTLKQAIKARHKAIRLAFWRKCFSFSKEDLLGGLRQVGVRPGDVLLVHSSFDQFAGFIGKPTEVNTTLQEAVGVNGSILMPTLPFTGSAVDYASREPVFDVRRTPSQMGILTELFRRQTGVMRSVHPTHSAAASGTMAEQLIADHHMAKTPCGHGTPFARLLEKNGRILFMGTGIGTMTFFHSVEEELESELPFSPFTKDVFTLRSRDWQGNELSTRTRLFEPVYSRRRNLDKLIPFLKKRGAWSQTQIGRLSLILLSAEAVLATCRDMAKQGIYCYDV